MSRVLEAAIEENRRLREERWASLRKAALRSRAANPEESLTSLAKRLGVGKQTLAQWLTPESGQISRP